LAESFDIERERAGEVSVLCLHGFLDAHTAPEFESAVQKEVDQGNNEIVVDGSKLTYISSAGLGVFMSFIEEIREKDGDLRICGLIPKVRQVFDILGFTELFRIFEGRTEALESFRKKG
jgi:anti-sigma B factor antagonist